MPTISLLGTKKKIVDLLRAGGIDDPVREASYIVSAALDQSRAALLALDEIDVPEDKIQWLDEMARRRAAHEPLARILGRKEFWGLMFGLNAHTLVPRPDTETLVSAALDNLPDRAADCRVLDLGTGSGCILLSLLHELPQATGLGVDLAPQAVEQAQANARSLKLERRATFQQSDWLSAVEGTFDVIVSNPPYIAEPEMFGLDSDVRDYDPLLALVGGADGLAAYRQLIPAALERLNSGGIFALECGQGQADALQKLVQMHNPALSVSIIKDLAGIDRVILIK